MTGYSIAITSWRPGLNKVKLDKLLAGEGGMGLANAKRAVDCLMAGESVTIGAFDDEKANLLAERIRELGAVCDVVGGS